MKDNRKDVNLAAMNEMLNNKTLRYRINGFAHACNMRDVGVMGDSGVLFNTVGFDKYGKKKVSDKHSYFIALNEYDQLYKKNIVLKGQYEDLTFTFTNFCSKRLNLNKKIFDLPFSILLEKKVDDITYNLHINTIENIRTRFIVSKSQEFKKQKIHNELCFYANVMDFSKILKIVKGFVYNPRLCFDTYNEVMREQKIVFTNNMLDKMAMQDEKLDKPMSKVKKIMKRITNND